MPGASPESGRDNSNRVVGRRPGRFAAAPHPKLTEALADYSWLIGNWTADQSYIEGSDGGSYLKLASSVQISPSQEGASLEIGYSLEGSMSAIAGFWATFSDRITVDPSTKLLEGSVVIKDSFPQAAGSTKKSEEGSSEYTLVRTSESVWKGEAKGNHRGSRTRGNVPITREQDDTLVITITNLLDRSLAGQSDLTVRLKRVPVGS